MSFNGADAKATLNLVRDVMDIVDQYRNDDEDTFLQAAVDLYKMLSACIVGGGFGETADALLPVFQKSQTQLRAAIILGQAWEN